MIAIRKAVQRDIDTLMAIYDHAKMFMASTGNTNQWIDGYPQREVIESDIESGNCHVAVDVAGDIVAVFALIPGNDPRMQK